MTYKMLLTSSCCLMTLFASSALAQTQTAPAGSRSVDEETAAPTVGDPVAEAKLRLEADKAIIAADPRDIIVTGTRITRPNNHSAAPITTTTAAEIAAQGATTIEEVLNRLPQVQANSEQNYADSDGRQRIKLRSLGFERTLTLVDGLRLGIQNGMDVSIIPNTLVERIDVLSGGASSVYGSDAVSGVVNFILKKNFDGIALTGNYSFYNHDNRPDAVTEAATRASFPTRSGMTNDGGRASLSLALGKTLFGGAVNITGFVAYRASESIGIGDRSNGACEVTQKVSTGVLTCTRSTYTPAGTIVPGGIGVGSTLVNNPNGSGTLVPWNSGPGTVANPYDEIAFQRYFNRINTGGFLTARLDDHVELYANALFYRDQSYNALPNRIYSYSAYGSTPFQVNCDNPFLSSSQRAALCGTQTSGLVPLDLRYRFDGLPLVQTRFVNKGMRIVAGVRGKVLDDVWSYDLAGVYSRNTNRQIYPGNPDFNRVNRSLNVVNVNGTPTCVAAIDGTDKACVPFNAFIPFNNDAAANRYLFTSVDGSSGSISRMWQGLLVINGDLGRYGITSPLAKQGVAVAFGGEFRDEGFIGNADAQYRATNGGTDSNYAQNVWEANAEVQAPLIEDRSWTQLLQLNGGYRRSKYNMLQGSFGTWKIEGIWSPIDDISFRGSFNKAQRAPTVIEAVQAYAVDYTTAGSRNDPCASTPDPNSSDPNARLPATATLIQCRRTGLPDNLYNSASLNCPDQTCTIRNGGFGLKPETAYTKTFGVVLRPRFLKGLTASADRFLIDLNDSISYIAANDFLNGCLSTGLSYYCRGVVRNPGNYTLYSVAAKNPTSGYFAQGTTNGYKSKSHGWDFQAQYTLHLGRFGSLDTSFNGSLTTLAGSQDSPDAKATNCVGYYGPFCGESLPKWKHGLRATWDTPDHIVHVSANWRHIGPMTISYNAAPSAGLPFESTDRRAFYTGVPTYDYIDLSIGFDVAKRFGLSVSVNNLFDRDPPLVPDSRSLLGLLHSNTMFGYDLLGRQIAVGFNARL
ncbi:TonB-dependent receptor domain-containing protein [Sphingomonas sp. XXL09]|uniref:TonB-dependent receptor domain-containing protein n=1 Tax=Sphingomonas sp. XXL09 TaxID=3457787 RepID=UPI00406BC108